MKEYRSKNPPKLDQNVGWTGNNFDFDVEHILAAKLGLVHYFLGQPNPQVKVSTNYDDEFAVAKISRIRDAIVAIQTNSGSSNCISKHINEVNKKRSTGTSIACKQRKQFSFAFCAQPLNDSVDAKKLCKYNTFRYISNVNMSNTTEPPTATLSN